MEINLKDNLNKQELSRKEKIYLILNHNNNEPKQLAEIKTIAKENGLREIEKWNISDLLSKSKGIAIKLKDGWVLTNAGLSDLSKIDLIVKTSPVKTKYDDLLKHSEKIKSDYVKEFITEAINSLQYKLLKSAVVFSWIGAISLLYEHIVNSHLSAFNTEALRRNSKWANAKNIDGLTRMGEYDFLQVIESIGVIGKNTKNELELCLKLRNSCGHPSTLKIGEQKVAAHIEVLLLNVYDKFS